MHRGCRRAKRWLNAAFTLGWQGFGRGRRPPRARCWSASAWVLACVKAPAMLRTLLDGMGVLAGAWHRVMQAPPHAGEDPTPPPAAVAPSRPA